MPRSLHGAGSRGYYINNAATTAQAANEKARSSAEGA